MSMRRTPGGCQHQRCLEIVVGLVAGQLQTIAQPLRAQVAAEALALAAEQRVELPPGAIMQRVARRRLAALRGDRK